MKVTINDIRDHLEGLGKKIGTVYDNTMERISEVYETKIRYRSLYFELALVFLLMRTFLIYTVHCQKTR